MARVQHAIYWHHAKPFRKKELVKLVDIYNKIDGFEEKYRDITLLVKTLLSSVTDISVDYLDSDEINLVENLEIPSIDNLLDVLDYKELPFYKKYIGQNSLNKYAREIGINAKNNLARTAIVTADRLISKLTAEALDEHIINKTLKSLLDEALQKDRGLESEIKSCLDGFETKYPNSDRNKAQKEKAEELADEEINVGVLNGPAGCGKTKIALEWALETSAKKIYWVCPRVQVCEGIFSDLCGNEYLPSSSIEIVTGEIKKTQKNGKVEETIEGEEFKADIIITTIDQLVNSITTHKHITTLMDFMNAHVVFDEYHEYITMQGFNLLFAELIEMKKYQQDDETLPNTLLVSATPNPLFVTKFLGIDEDSIIGMDSFNNSSYKIEFVEFDDKDEATNPLMQEQSEKNTFVISNTAIMAQRSFIEHQAKENNILFHSKFTKSDKEMLFDEVFESFKKGGTKKYDVLRSGPVVQASLNITCKKMISEMSHAENFLQRLGRLDRFGESDEVNVYTIAITEGVRRGKVKDSSSKFLNDKLFALQSTKAWYEFLQNSLTKEIYTINELYKIYKDFYSDETAKELITQDLIKALKRSVKMIENNVLDPKNFPKSKKEEKGIKIKKNSLRGNSLFVQMAKVQIDSTNDFDILNEYAYENIESAITLEASHIKGKGDADESLLVEMAKIHEIVKELDNIPKKYRELRFENDARDPKTPIFLSYLPKELEKYNKKAHKNAYYYAIGTKQPIGIIQLNRLEKGTEDEK